MDDKPCKVMSEPGEYFCEHHRQDIRALIRTPQEVTNLMAKRYPKRHEPMCDEKGRNTCDCHEYSSGALGVMSIKKAFDMSAALSPLYRKRKRFLMRKKVRHIRDYYESIDETELWLPPNPSRRQFRFFIWHENKQRVIARNVKDCIRDKKTMLTWLRKLTPLSVYYTTTEWLTPQALGPDPLGTKGESNFSKKGWRLRQYHNTMIHTGLYFDVDYANRDYNEGAIQVGKLLDLIEEKIPGTEAQVVFSGSKGFHVIYADYLRGEFSEWGVKNQIMKKLSTATGLERVKRQFYIEDLQPWSDEARERGIHIDHIVTCDYSFRRIIRLPGTVHHKTLRVCKIVDWDSEQFTRDESGEVIGFTPDDPIG